MIPSESKPQSKEEPYKPISCGLYDKLESDATQGKLSQISFRKDGEEISIQSKIKTFKVIKSVEYMILEDGVEIRLDHLISFNKLPATFK